jgi:hypothetical protein
MPLSHKQFDSGTFGFFATKKASKRVDVFSSENEHAFVEGKCTEAL